MKNKQKTWRYIFAVVVLAIGIILEYLKIGKEFLGFSSVGTWLIYIGFVMIVIIRLQFIKNKKRIIDERMIKISYKATRITFVAIILVAFFIMILDGINPINLAYSMFMSYLICFMIITYFISYKILEKHN